MQYRLRFAFLFALLAPACLRAAHLTELDRYVARPDPHYKYTLVRTLTEPTYTTYILDMTSQQWRTPAEVNPSIWRHWLILVRPAKVTSSTALLFIDGGSNTAPPPSHASTTLIATALSSHSVVADLRDVPNQPTVFPDDGKQRSEDAIIAYTWDKYLHGGDADWPLRLPMTKAAVRAMDTVTAFSKTPAGGSLDITHFVVAGASKRGWTTWTTSAVDKRVVACAPIVIDALNVEKSFTHHYEAYGFWAPAIKDYQDMNIMDWFGTKRYHELMQEVDPFSYRDRLTMPKYMINAADDQFFLPDSSQFYFPALKGEKFLRYIPNTGHDLKGTDAADSLIAYYDAIVNRTPLPEVHCSFPPDGSIYVEATPAPAEVLLWCATNPTARDFRIDTVGRAYHSQPLQPSPDGSYIARVGPPPHGFTAYFVELTYPMGDHKFKLTTAVRVTPDKVPFPPPPEPMVKKPTAKK